MEVIYQRLTYQSHQKLYLDNMERKKLSEMTQEEVKQIPDIEWGNWNPFEKKSCDTCLHLVQAVSLWCNCIPAIEKRGTRLPGVYRCDYWVPDWKHIPKKYDTVYYHEQWKNQKPNVPAKAPKEPSHSKEENISKNKQRWLKIKSYIRGLT